MVLLEAALGEGLARSLAHRRDFAPLQILLYLLDRLLFFEGSKHLFHIEEVVGEFPGFVPIHPLDKELNRPVNAARIWPNIGREWFSFRVVDSLAFSENFGHSANFFVLVVTSLTLSRAQHQLIKFKIVKASTGFWGFGVLGLLMTRRI